MARKTSKKRIKIKGRGTAEGSSGVVSWFESVTLIEIRKSVEPSLVGSEGGSHDIKTSRNVDISHKSLRISSEISHIEGPNLKVYFLFMSL